MSADTAGRRAACIVSFADSATACPPVARTATDDVTSAYADRYGVRLSRHGASRYYRRTSFSRVRCDDDDDDRTYNSVQCSAVNNTNRVVKRQERADYDDQPLRAVPLYIQTKSAPSRPNACYRKVSLRYSNLQVVNNGAPPPYLSDYCIPVSGADTKGSFTPDPAPRGTVRHCIQCHASPLSHKIQRRMSCRTRTVPRVIRCERTLRGICVLPTINYWQYRQVQSTTMDSQILHADLRRLI